MTQIERLNKANKELEKNEKKLREGILKQMELIENLRRIVSAPGRSAYENNVKD